jgi:hypothetical protein
MTIGRFFGKVYSGTEDETDAAVSKLKETLPAHVRFLDEHDVSTILVTTFDSIASALSPYYARQFDSECNRSLAKIEKLCSELRPHLSKVSEATFVGGRRFRDSWISQVFGFDLVRAPNGSLVQIPINSQSPTGQRLTPEHAVYLLEVLANDILAARKRTTESGRPEEDLLSSVCYPLCRAWVALNLMSGSAVSQAFPTMGNLGQGWCLRAVEYFASGNLLPNNRLTKMKRRTEKTVKGAILKASRELKRRLIELPYCEDKELWSSLGWDSYCGLDVISRASNLQGPDLFTMPSKHWNDYYAAWLGWCRRNDTQPPPQWVDDY